MRVTMPTKSNPRKVPNFRSEAEEAKWWDDHKQMVEDNLIAAMRSGAVRRGLAQQLVQAARSSKNVTIRLAEADLALARKQAEEKGLPYQTYIKSVLHEELVKRGRRKGS